MFGGFPLLVCGVGGMFVVDEISCRICHAMLRFFMMRCGHRSMLDALNVAFECSTAPHQTVATSLLPRSILILSTPHLSPLQQTLSPPLPPRRIHIPRRLHRDPGSGPHCRNLFPAAAFQFRHVDVLSRVELKGRLRAQDFQVQFRAGMGHADEGAER